MLSRTQIANDALRHIAATPIGDFDEDSEAARQVKGCYDQVVRGELESHPWFFAKKQAALPQNEQGPLYRYGRSFNLPADFIRLVEFETRWVFSSMRYIDSNPIPLYEMHGRTIMTDAAAPLRIGYISDDVLGDPTAWSPLFANVVAAALALRLASTLTKSDGVVARCADIYKNEVARARKSNAIQMPPQNIPDGSWLTARLY